MDNEVLINVNNPILQPRNKRFKSFRENQHVEYMFCPTDMGSFQASMF